MPHSSSSGSHRRPPPHKIMAPQPKRRRLLILRTLVCLSLIVTCLLYALGTYYLFQTRAVTQREATFTSVAKQLNEFSLVSVSKILLALKSVARVLATICPQESQWPNCAIPIKSFDNISTPLLTMANGRSIGFAPIISPNQISSFENFSSELYNQSGIRGLGTSSIGKGIYRYRNGTQIRVTNSTGGRMSILTPILVAADLARNSQSFMFDFHSYYAPTIENVVQCYQSFGRDGSCIAYSDLMCISVAEAVLRPSLLVFAPISPKTAPDTIVGLTFFVLNWDKLLSLALPSYLRGIDVVLTSNWTHYYTFRASGGYVTYKGSGDLHDRDYSHLGYSFDLLSLPGQIHYSITLYPTTAFLTQYSSVSAVITSVVALSTILLTVIIFFLYDRLRNRDAHEKAIIGNTKRLFVRFISHEIRTPLNTVHLGIKLFLQELASLSATLKTRPGSPQISKTIARIADWIELAKEIESSSDASIVVLNDLINYDKISIGGLEIQIAEANLWLTTFNAVIPFNIQAKQSGVNLSLDLEITRSPSALDAHRLEALTKLCILGDEGKLSQVVRNLVSNALKFTPSGGLVSVTLYWDDSPHNVDGDENSKRFKSSSLFQKSHQRSVLKSHTHLGNFVCVVRDTGYGISPENMAHLFKEGMQFHANQLQAGGGSGLGLWISKGIVEMHGGTLTAQSDGEGQGCCFTLRLPAFHCENPDFASVSAEMSKQLTTIHSEGVSDDLLQLQAMLSSAKIRKVLVVDDVLSSRKIICRLLRLAGCQFVEAVNGQDCIDKLGDETLFPVPPDLILMDYEMPIMDGPTAAFTLRENGCLLTIIGLTGNVLQEDIDYFMQHGANAVLPKPLTVMRFIHCLGELTKVHANHLSHFVIGDGDGRESCVEGCTVDAV